MDPSFEHPPATPQARRRFSPAYRGLPAPVRLGALAVVAILAGAVVGTLFPGAMGLLGAAAALAPGKLAWYGVRIAGLLAYLALGGSVVYGLLLSTGLLDAIAHRPVSFHLHRDLALAGLALSALHGLLLLGDRTFAFTPVAIAVPFASPYAPLAVGVGQLAFGAIALVAASFYVRRWIGQRAWRLIHYLTFLAFAGVAVHGIASGTDTLQPWAPWLYGVPLSAVAFLVAYRLAIGLAERRAGGGTSRVLVAEPRRVGR